MELVPKTGMRKPLHIIGLAWVCLSSILLWVFGRDLVEWTMHAPLWQLLSLQFFNSALSSIIIVELLRTVMPRWEQWNNRQHLRAILFTCGIVFVVSSAMLAYGRLSM